jgi:cytidylate kinase
MIASVVCVSHTDGSHGETIARRVAAELGFRYADESIVVAAAEEKGLFPEAVSQVERRSTGRVLEVDFGRFERTDALRDLIRAAIDRTADEGSVVIAAHAASFALVGRTGVLRVLLTASLETRAGRLVQAGNGIARDVVKDLAESDKGRAVYLRRFYGVKAESPTDYDLVVNTDALAVEPAVAAIVAAATG